ncbi:MAG: hypothetical protein V2G48_06165 [bacterium JZ-2024 1]
MSQLDHWKRQIILEALEYFQSNWSDEDEEPTYDAVEELVEKLIEEYYTLGQIDEDLHEALMDSVDQMASTILTQFSVTHRGKETLEEDWDEEMDFEENFEEDF